MEEKKLIGPPRLEKTSERKEMGFPRKHRCPRCGKPSFVRYINFYDDGTKEYIAPEVGKCDHIAKCQYHVRPEEYYTTHPEKRPGAREGYNPSNYTQKPYKLKITPSMQQICAEQSIFPVEAYNAYSKDGDNNQICDLHAFLNYLIPAHIVERVFREYRVGMTDKSATIFWYFDREGRCRSGKRVVYDREGHRDKTIKPFWLHADLISKKVLPPDWKLAQPLFGEHLLSKDTEAPVVLTEAEKTCLVGRCIHPGFIWVATGGATICLDTARKVLAGRKVLALPDSDAAEDWKKKIGADIAICERFCVPGTTDDYADIVLEQLKQIR